MLSIMAGKVGDVTAGDIREQFRREFSGTDNFGALMILEPGMKVEHFVMLPQPAERYGRRRYSDCPDLWAKRS